MEPLKVSIEVNVNLSQDTKDFLAKLIFGVANPVAPVIPTPAPSPEPEPETPAKPAEPAPKPEPEPKPEPKPAPAHNLTDLRLELGKKVDSHRAEIKDKLTALGTPSLTKLKEDKYEDMYNFLISLS